MHKDRVKFGLKRTSGTDVVLRVSVKTLTMDNLPVIVVDTETGLIGSSRNSVKKTRNVLFPPPNDFGCDVDDDDLERTQTTEEHLNLPAINSRQSKTPNRNFESINELQSKSNNGVKERLAVHSKGQTLRRHLSLDSSSNSHIGLNVGLSLSKSLNIVRRRMSEMKTGNDISSGFLRIVSASRSGSARLRSPKSELVCVCFANTVCGLVKIFRIHTI